jgi:hypothetical protein
MSAFPTHEARLAELERRARAGESHLPPDLARAMSGTRHRPRPGPPPAPPIAASLPVSDEHFSYIWQGALSVPENLRGQFYEMVAVDLKRINPPVTARDVANAISAALKALLIDA